MNRGIASTIVIPDVGDCLEKVYEIWNETYASKPFVGILKSGQTPDTKWVYRTNRIDFSAIFDPRTNNLIITSAEDNLMKGASGQAIQIMNIWNGYDESAGLT